MSAGCGARSLPSRNHGGSARSVETAPVHSEARRASLSTQPARLLAADPTAPVRKRGDSSLYFETLGHPTFVAPGKIGHTAQSLCLEEARRDRGPAAALAVQHDREGWIELAEPLRQCRQRNMRCPGNMP